MIPSIKSGFDAFREGFGLSDNLMKQILARKQLEQQQKQHEANLALHRQREGFVLSNNLMKQILARKQLEQQQKQHEANLALHRQQQARLNQLMPLQMQKLEMETNPAKKMAYINTIMQGIREMQGGQQGAVQTKSQGGMQPFQGIGMPPSIEEIENTQQLPQERQPSQPPAQQGFRGFTPEQQIAMSLAGIKVPQVIETPQMKEARAIRTADTITQNKENLKIRETYEKELPKSKVLIDRIAEAIPLINDNKDLFGSGALGFDILGGPNQKYRRLKDPKKIAAFKKLSNLFAELQGAQASDFSSRALNVAFDLAKQAKTSMEDHPEAAEQTLKDILKKMKTLRASDISRFKKAGGNYEEKQQQRVKYNPVTGDFD